MAYNQSTVNVSNNNQQQGGRRDVYQNQYTPPAGGVLQPDAPPTSPYGNPFSWWQMGMNPFGGLPGFLGGLQNTQPSWMQPGGNYSNLNTQQNQPPPWMQQRQLTGGNYPSGTLGGGTTGLFGNMFSGGGLGSSIFG